MTEGGYDAAVLQDAAEVVVDAGELHAENEALRTAAEPQSISSAGGGASPAA